MEERFSLIKPYEGKANYIFVSYSHKDTDKVFPLLRKLTENGYRIWYDEGIDPGTEWPESIAKHLADCKVCLSFISNSSVKSTNCRREINYALARNKDFLSVVLEPVMMSPGMDMQISSYQSLLSYKYPTRDAFENKLLSLDILKSCKEIIAHEVKDEEIPEERREEKTPVEPAQKPEEVPARKEASAIPFEKEEKKVKKKKEKPVRQEGKKGLGKIFLAVLAAAAVIGAILIIPTFQNNKVIIDNVEYENLGSVTVKDASVDAKEIKSLAKLSECRYLFFENCTFENGAESNLKELAELDNLGLYNCTGISDLSFLNSLQSLSVFTAQNCGLTDDTVKGLDLGKSVSSLNMSYNNLTFVPKAKELEWLDLTGNQITNLDNLTGMTTLLEIRLGSNKISDISALKDSTKVIELDLSNNQLTSIADLEGFVYLEELYLGNNDITDVSPLKYCTHTEKPHSIWHSTISPIVIKALQSFCFDWRQCAKHSRTWICNDMCASI